jgi:hypothetical protein
VTDNSYSCWDTVTQTRLWQITPASRHCHIGFSALSPDGRAILASNLCDGMDLYRLGQSCPVQSFRYSADPINNYPISVAFVDDGRVAFCGSPTGRVALWKTKTGDLQQILDHAGWWIHIQRSFYTHRPSHRPPCSICLRKYLIHYGILSIYSRSVSPRARHIVYRYRKLSCSQ